MSAARRARSSGTGASFRRRRAVGELGEQFSVMRRRPRQRPFGCGLHRCRCLGPRRLPRGHAFITQKRLQWEGPKVKGAVLAARLDQHGKLPVIPGPAEWPEPGIQIQTLLRDVGIEVFPIRIVLFDQGNFPRTSPLFDFLFARNCACWVVVNLEPNQATNIIFRCEARQQLLPVLVYSAHKAARDAKVERSLFFAREQIDVEQLKSPEPALDSGFAG